MLLSLLRTEVLRGRRASRQTVTEWMGSFPLSKTSFIKKSTHRYASSNPVQVLLSLQCHMHMYVIFLIHGWQVLCWHRCLSASQCIMASFHLEGAQNTVFSHVYLQNTCLTKYSFPKDGKFHQNSDNNSFPPSPNCALWFLTGGRVELFEDFTGPSELILGIVFHGGSGACHSSPYSLI